MSKAAPLVSSFNSGELSPRLEGRVDLAKYPNGCRILENFIPLVAGGALKRSGTRYIASEKTESKPVNLIAFEFSTEQTYILEFGDLYMRVFMDGGAVLALGIPYEIVTPYQAEDVGSILWAQSADVLYLAHPGYPPQKVSRTAHDAWTITPINFDWPAFRPENQIKTLTLQASAATGAGITITASSALFTADDVGRLLKLGEIVESKHPTWVANLTHGWVVNTDIQYQGNVYNVDSVTGVAVTTGTSPPIHELGTESDGRVPLTYLHAGYGYALITGFTSTTQVTATVVQTLPASVVSAATDKWAWGAWDSVSGFPRAVAFFEDRLWWAGSDANPQTMWGSRTGDYENHRVNDIDESAVSFTINQGEVNVIHWLMAWRQLVLGTSGGEIVAAAQNPDEAISGTNPPNLARNQSTYGSREGVKPLRVENSLLFVQRGGQKFRELVYDFDSDSYIANDTTVLADHIALGKIRQIAYQQEPSRIVWAVLDNGELIALTYERTQQVVGWHRHVLGGTGSAVESVAVIHSDDGDEVWLSVRRTINAMTHRYIERLEPEWVRGTPLDEAFFVDSGINYSGGPATLLTGLDHLEGETVQILADGAVHPDRVVTGGQINLAIAASRVQVGLPYISVLQTMRLEAGAANGTAQGRAKQVADAVFRLDQTGAGLFYGGENDPAKMAQVYFRDSLDPTGEPVPLFDGDTPRLPWPQGYDRDARLTLHHRLPVPCTILAMFPHVQTQDR